MTKRKEAIVEKAKQYQKFGDSIKITPDPDKTITILYKEKVLPYNK